MQGGDLGIESLLIFSILNAFLMHIILKHCVHSKQLSEAHKYWDATLHMGIFWWYSYSFSILIVPCFQGTNSHGQLGQGFESELVSVPTATIIPKELEQTISCNSQITGGGNHSIVISNGRVWGAGLDNTGQLCSSEKKSSNIFSEIPALAACNVIAVACGWDFSLFLASNGTLYGCGSNTFNQLGISSKVWNTIHHWLFKFFNSYNPALFCFFFR